LNGALYHSHGPKKKENKSAASQLCFFRAASANNFVDEQARASDEQQAQ
jgi:hypothetical protein